MLCAAQQLVGANRPVTSDVLDLLRPVGSYPNNDQIGDPPPKERGEIKPLIGKSSFRPYSLT
jgi:hypothetical protein